MVSERLAHADVGAGAERRQGLNTITHFAETRHLLPGLQEAGEPRFGREADGPRGQAPGHGIWTGAAGGGRHVGRSIRHDGSGAAAGDDHRPRPLGRAHSGAARQRQPHDQAQDECTVAFQYANHRYLCSRTHASHKMNPRFTGLPPFACRLAIGDPITFIVPSGWTMLARSQTRWVRAPYHPRRRQAVPGPLRTSVVNEPLGLCYT